MENRKYDLTAFIAPISDNNAPKVEVITPDVKTQNTGVLVDIKGITHTFNEGTPLEYRLFDNFNLQINDAPDRGEVISLMGGSGCGKSCILKMIAGLMTPQQGEILIHGKTLKEYGNVPMVFQAYSNYVWMTVLDNVALPYVLKGVSQKEAREKAMELVKLVGLEQHAMKFAKASTLSGGQLQRISIARCLANNSKVFLLDEATGALDIKMKKEIQDLIIKLCYDSNYQPTIINVTHSVEEAVYMSNKIIVLKPNPCTIYKTMDITPIELDSNGNIRNYTKELTGILAEVCG